MLQSKNSFPVPVLQIFERQYGGYLLFLRVALTPVHPNIK